MKIRTYTLIMIAVGLFFITMVIVFLSTFQDKNEDYIMPNGVVCDDYFYSGFGGSYKFDDCTDGREYLDPEYWEVIEENDAFQVKQGEGQ